MSDVVVKSDAEVASDFAPRSAAEYERETLAYWLASLPGLDCVTVIVRRRGKVARVILLEPADAASPAAGGQVAP
jgi:hypothetical protein